MSRAEQTKSGQRQGARENLANGAQGAELCFKVAEMTDGDSVKAITRQVRELDGIASIQIDLHTGWVVVTGQRLDARAIRRAISRAGYEAQL